MVAYNQTMRIRSFGRAGNPASTTSSAVTVLQNSPEPVNLSAVEAHNNLAASTMEHLKRHSLPGLTGKKDKDKDKDKHREAKRGSPSPALRPVKPMNKLDMIAESPPNMLYGTPDASTGALFSGQLRLTVVDPELTLDTFEMKLNALVTTKRPVGKDCADCITKTTQLHKWTFIKEPKKLLSGEHSFPFSYLLPGHLPATTHGHIGVIQYFLDANATSKSPSTTPGANNTITMLRELPLYRAMPESRDRGHVRVFPPTNLAAHVSFAPVIHPIGDVPIQMRINGCVDRNESNGMQMRWRLHKMIWKLEEKEIMISPACPKHSHKVGGEGKGIQHEDTHVIGQGDMKAGWKTDISEGTIEMEFSCRPSGNPRPLCDVNSPSGLNVTHTMIIELVISEEMAKNKNPESSQGTGSARVLRMQFPVVITERAGMGISWDEEAPPMYGDVPASPPVYPQRDFDLSELRIVDETRAGGEMLDYTGPPLGPPPSFEEEIVGFDLGVPMRGVTDASRPAATISGEQGSSSSANDHPGRAEQQIERSGFSLNDFDADWHPR